MQADEFEKKIQAKMEGFELVPDSEVWKQVSVRIEKEKKKRKVLLYWLFTGFVLLAGTSMWWFSNNNNGSNKKLVINKVNNNNTIQEENYKIKQNIHNPLHSNTMKKIKSLKAIEYFKKDDVNHLFKTAITNNARSAIIYPKVITKTPVLFEKKEYNKNDVEEKSYVQKSLPLHKFYNPQAAIAAKKDTVLKNKDIDARANFIKDTSAYALSKKAIAKKLKINKKWEVGFAVFSGVSDIVSGLPLVQKNYAEDYASSPASLPGGLYNSGGNNSYSANTVNNFSSGFSFGLGIFVEKHVTKQLSLSVEADYHLYTAKSAVGSKVNQQRTFYDSSLQKSTLVNGYYTIGGSTKYSNKYQLIELPIKLKLQINKNQEKPLVVSAGISPGYLVSSNALYANPSANVYYVDKQKFQHFQLSAQMGFLFPIAGSSKYSLSAGPVVQYGFTDAAKTAIGINQHLLFTGIKANVILK